MSSNRCGAGDRCGQPELQEALHFTNCHTCGAFFHLRCLPRKDTMGLGLGDAEADDREVLEVFHCPGDCTTKAKEVG